MKEITITVPDNCELKQDGNTYTIIEKEKKLTYEDVAKELFYDRFTFFTGVSGEINSDTIKMRYTDPNNAITERQLEKLLATNKLMNVAKYLNGDWQPDWKTATIKYQIALSSGILGGITISTTTIENNGGIYFKSNELAKQAIEILGEETIRLALCTNY